MLFFAHIRNFTTKKRLFPNAKKGDHSPISGMISAAAQAAFSYFSTR